MTANKRTLTPGELALARKAFPASFPFARVTMVSGAYGNPAAMAAFRNGNTAITLGRTIYFRPDKYRPELAAGSADEQDLLIHELTHIWQYARLGMPRFFAIYAGNFLGCGMNAGKMYDYKSDPRPFAQLRLEAQAQMVGNYASALARDDATTRQALAARLKETGFFGL